MSKETGSSLFWLCSAVLICIFSLQLPLGNFRNPGPGFFPFITGLTMGVFAAIVYFQSRRPTPSAKENKGALWTHPGGVKKVVLTTLSLLIYVASMEYFGFLISTFLFLVFLLRTMERQRWVLVMIESLLASGAFYFVFEIWLQAQLPRGILQP